MALSGRFSWIHDVVCPTFECNGAHSHIHTQIVQPHKLHLASASVSVINYTTLLRIYLKVFGIMGLWVKAEGWRNRGLFQRKWIFQVTMNHPLRNIIIHNPCFNKASQDAVKRYFLIKSNPTLIRSDQEPPLEPHGLWGWIFIRRYQ